MHSAFHCFAHSQCIARPLHSAHCTKVSMNIALDCVCMCTMHCIAHAFYTRLPMYGAFHCLCMCTMHCVACGWCTAFLVHTCCALHGLRMVQICTELPVHDALHCSCTCRMPFIASLWCISQQGGHAGCIALHMRMQHALHGLCMVHHINHAHTQHVALPLHDALNYPYIMHCIDHTHA